MNAFPEEKQCFLGTKGAGWCAGMGYEDGDPSASFLPSPVEVDEKCHAPYMRAVVFVTEHTIKGSDRHPQEYQSPLLILSGED
jgi:hypothetical protein